MYVDGVVLICSYRTLNQLSGCTPHRGFNVCRCLFYTRYYNVDDFLYNLAFHSELVQLMFLLLMLSSGVGKTRLLILHSHEIMHGIGRRTKPFENVCKYRNYNE